VLASHVNTNPVANAIALTASIRISGFPRLPFGSPLIGTPLLLMSVFRGVVRGRM